MRVNNYRNCILFRAHFSVLKAGKTRKKVGRKVGFGKKHGKKSMKKNLKVGKSPKKVGFSPLLEHKSGLENGLKTTKKRHFWGIFDCF